MGGLVIPGRYLQPDEKDAEVKRFTEYRWDDANYRGPGQGGAGYIDREILPTVDALNELKGVLVIQSCCGHREVYPCDCPGGVHRGDEIVKHEVLYPGQLWLRLSFMMSRRFEERVGELVGAKGIRSVRKLYSLKDDSRRLFEVVDVQFAGYDVSEVAFMESIVWVEHVFRRCAGEIV